MQICEQELTAQLLIKIRKFTWMNKYKQSQLPPLAERMRPKTLESFVGQNSIVGESEILSTLTQQNRLISMIFWGPPGTGKTTLVRIIAKHFDCEFYQLSAVDASVKDIRQIIRSTKDNLIFKQQSPILFIDEIHRFNKAQQDSLLHAVEDGTITLLGATTENPSFEIISPLLSRCRVLVLQHHTNDELEQILDQTLNSDLILSAYPNILHPQAKHLLVHTAGGDARKMLNTLELAFDLSSGEQITTEIISKALQEKTVIYDKTGDYHYDTISAFVKSVRGSDPDAAIYWLAVMLEGGEKPEFIIRRLIILASEDIGNADPTALSIAVSGFQAVQIIGMPESSLILSQITTYLAAAPKSDAATIALRKATAEIRKNGTKNVPLHLRNAPTEFAQKQHHGKDYKYVHNFPQNFVEQNYFPENILHLFYNPTQNGYEKFIRNRLKSLWKKRFE